MTLSDFFNENNRVALGFSGGADSSYLLYEAKKCGADVKAYYVKTAFQPQFEYDDAIRLSKAIGATLEVIELDILALPQVAENSALRCYHCKAAIFGAICSRAERDGFGVVVDGTNASDDVADRPGMRALTELSVRSPLRECGITKDVIRLRLKEAGLPVWNKPAYSCLATRVPCGKRITPALLKKVEGSESVLFSLGFSGFRARIAEGGALLEFTAGQLPAALEREAEIGDRLKKYFSNITIDMKAREPK